MNMEQVYKVCKKQLAYLKYLRLYIVSSSLVFGMRKLQSFEISSE